MTDHSQGSRSLSVKTSGNTWIESTPLTSLGSRVVGPFHIDVKLPTQLQQVSPYWYGAVQLYVDSPTVGLNNVYVGQAELTGLPLAQWKTLTITPTADVLAKLKATYSDLRVRISVNVPSEITQPFLLDDLRFSDAIAATNVTARNSMGELLIGATITAYQGGVATSYTGVTNSAGVAQLRLPPGSFRFGVTSGSSVAFSEGTCVVPGECSGDEVIVVLFDERTQTPLNMIYDIENVLTIRIAMDPAEWELLKTQQPVGGTCNFDLPYDEDVERFPWQAATVVTIEGTSYPSSPFSVVRWGVALDDGPQIKKKSYCGSFTDKTDEKPAIKLKLPNNEATLQFGTRHLTLNNGMQDPTYVRQLFGYKLFGMAGLPHSRGNYARVYVNDVLVNDGIFVNVEPVREGFLDNPENGFTNTTNANLYEIEKDDFIESRLPYLDVEKVSPFDTKIDFFVAAQQIAKGLSGMEKVIDMDNFIKMLAMDFLLKNWDGFAVNLNNTYIYNDAVAVQYPNADAGNVRFKLIPWGLDQVLSTGAKFEIGTKSILGELVLDDTARRAELQNQIKTYRETIFSRAKVEGDLNDFINLMQSTVTSLGADASKVAEGADKLRLQMKLARSAALLFGGGPEPQVGYYVLDHDTGDALYRSSEVFISEPDREVIHRPRDGSGADLWRFGPSSFPMAMYTVTSVSDPTTPQYLHASVSESSAGHKVLYTTPLMDLVYPKQDYVIHPEFSGAPIATEYTGYFQMENVESVLCLFFGDDDPTSGGSQRVYQKSCLDAGFKLYWY